MTEERVGDLNSTVDLLIMCVKTYYQNGLDSIGTASVGMERKGTPYIAEVGVTTPCPNCGEHVLTNHRYCPECGNEMGGEE